MASSAPRSPRRSRERPSAPPRVKRESVDRYLSAIHEMSFTVGPDTPDAGHPVSLVRLSERLGVSDASAWEMLRRLDGAGYVRHERRVVLTQAGVEHAGRVLRARRIIGRFLVETLDYSAAEAHDEAEALAGTATPRMVEMMHLRCGRPERDPDGWPIDPEQARREGASLPTVAAAAPGDRLVLRRLDRAPLAAIATEHEPLTRPGVVLAVVDRPPVAAADDPPSTRVAIDGRSTVLPGRLASALHAAPAS